MRKVSYSNWSLYINLFMVCRSPIHKGGKMRTAVQPKTRISSDLATVTQENLPQAGCRSRKVWKRVDQWGKFEMRSEIFPSIYARSVGPLAAAVQFSWTGERQLNKNIHNNHNYQTTGRKKWSGGRSAPRGFTLKMWSLLSEKRAIPPRKRTAHAITMAAAAAPKSRMRNTIGKRTTGGDAILKPRARKDDGGIRGNLSPSSSSVAGKGDTGEEQLTISISPAAAPESSRSALSCIEC